MAEVAYRLNAAVALVAAWAAAAIMVAITLLILLEITLRTLFGRSTHIAEEFVGYGLGAIIFLGLAHCMERGSLVRVDLVVSRLSARLRRLVEILICLLTLATMSLVIYYFFVSVLRHYATGTISMTMAATPLWIPEAVILTGMIIFSLQIAVYCLRLVAGGDILDEQARPD